jgi:hypothetical protein
LVRTQGLQLPGDVVAEDHLLALAGAILAGNGSPLSRRSSTTSRRARPWPDGASRANASPSCRQGMAQPQRWRRPSGCRGPAASPAFGLPRQTPPPGSPGSWPTPQVAFQRLGRPRRARASSCVTPRTPSSGGSPSASPMLPAGPPTRRRPRAASASASVGRLRA